MCHVHQISAAQNKERYRTGERRKKCSVSSTAVGQGIPRNLKEFWASFSSEPLCSSVENEIVKRKYEPRSMHTASRGKQRAKLTAELVPSRQLEAAVKTHTRLLPMKLRVACLQKCFRKQRFKCAATRRLIWKRWKIGDRHRELCVPRSKDASHFSNCPQEHA